MENETGLAHCAWAHKCGNISSNAARCFLIFIVSVCLFDKISDIYFLRECNVVIILLGCVDFAIFWLSSL